MDKKTTTLLEEIADILSDIDYTMNELLEGMKEWKNWDKMHHLEELETKKIVQHILELQK